MKKLRLSLLVFCALLLSTVAGASGGPTWQQWARRKWIPRDLPGAPVAGWYDAAFTTLGTTLKAGGTTPPAITLSGTLTTPYGIRIEIQTTGARGSSTFRVSLDNGSTYLASSVATAATYAIGGTAVTLNFPSATYTNDDTYQATIATWRDQSGAGHDITQSTAGLQGLFISSGQNGRPTVRLDGSDDFYTGTFTLNQPWTLVPVYKSVALGASGVHDIAFDGGTTASCALITNSTPAWAPFAGSSLSVASAVANGAFAQVSITFNNTSSVGRANGSQLVAGTAGANNAGGFTIGALANGTRAANIEVGEVVLVSGALANADRAVLEGYQKAAWATP